MGCGATKEKAQSPQDNKLHQRLTANDKFKALWSCIEADPKQHGFKGSTLQAIELMVSDLNPTFDHTSDQMYPSCCKHAKQATKDIHMTGCVAAVEWVSYNNHSYTGAFRGTKNMIVRASQSVSPDFGANANYAPAFAFKALRTNAPSATLLAMHAFQVTNFNTLGQDYSNHIGALNNSSTQIPTAHKILVKKFDSVESATPFRVATSPWATFEEDGTKNERPSFPFRVQFHPPKELRERWSSNPPQDKNPHWQSEQLMSLPEGTVLFHIYVEDVPNSCIVAPEPIGEIRLTHKFRYSGFSDRSLFFQHHKIDEDLQFHPEWKRPLLEEHQEQRKCQKQYTYPMAPDVGSNKKDKSQPNKEAGLIASVQGGIEGGLQKVQGIFSKR